MPRHHSRSVRSQSRVWQNDLKSLARIWHNSTDHFGKNNKKSHKKQLLIVKNHVKHVGN